MIALVSVVLFLTACRSSQQVATVPGMRDIELPCVQYGYDTDQYFAGMGIGENINAQNARQAALDAARRIINSKIGRLAKGLSTDYSRTMAGNAQQNDVQGVMEQEITSVVERMLNDANQVCEKLYQTPAGVYQSHLAIQISKKEVASQTSKALSENQKLETLFNREQFRKWAEQYLKDFDAGK